MINPTPHAPPLIVVSIDGMRPDFYRKANEFGLNIPHILKLVETGASADAVESIYPTTTYPAHATLVTGVPPSVHGIYSHLASLDPTEKSRPWTWFAAGIRVPTLWDVGRAIGKKTAAVGWPVSAGARIEYNIPEIWDPALTDPERDFSTAAQHSTRGLFAEVWKHLESNVSGPRPDRLRAEAALYLWQHYHPDLLLVHLVEYDQMAHQFGPDSSEALQAIEHADQEVGRFCDQALDGHAATIVVLSDHGFVPVDKEAAPLVALAEEGLFGRGPRGRPELKRLGAVHAGGSFALYWLEEPEADDEKRLERALRKFQGTGAVAAILDRGKLAELEADPDAQFMLDAAPGFYFSDRFERPVVRPSVKDRGTHGQLPSRPGLEAGFIAAGRDIAAGKNLGQFSLTQVAPTLAHLLALPRDILASQSEPLDMS